MNLTEIINRPNSQAIEENESLFVIKRYIMARKHVDVELNIKGGLNSLDRHIELVLMNNMLNHAIAWFRANPDRIE